MGNPVEDFLKHAAAPVGEGGLRGMAQHGGNMLAQGIGAGVGAALLTGGAVAAEHIYNAATAKRDFRGMLEWNQDLHHEDQRLVTQSFRTLRQFAPDMSKDPMVSGSIVRQMVQSPQGAAGIMSQAMQSQKNVGSRAMDAFTLGASKGSSEGAKSLRPFGGKAPVEAPQAHNTEHQSGQQPGAYGAGFSGAPPEPPPSNDGGLGIGAFGGGRRR